MNNNDQGFAQTLVAQRKASKILNTYQIELFVDGIIACFEGACQKAEGPSFKGYYHEYYDDGYHEAEFSLKDGTSVSAFSCLHHYREFDPAMIINTIVSMVRERVSLMGFSSYRVEVLSTVLEKQERHGYHLLTGAPKYKVKKIPANLLYIEAHWKE